MRTFLIENLAFSEIFTSDASPPSLLTDLFQRRRLDHCELGATMEGSR